MSIFAVIVGGLAGSATLATLNHLQGEHFIEYGLSGFRTGTIPKTVLSVAAAVGAFTLALPEKPVKPIISASNLAQPKIAQFK